MLTFDIDPNHLAQLAALDSSIRELNIQKIKLIFDAIHLPISDVDFEKLMDWKLIILTVPDKQMSVRLNKLSSYIPNLKFVVDRTLPIFTLIQGNKSRRVWKER